MKRENDEFYALDSLYQEIILDHYRSPRNKGMIEIPDVKEHETNPLCGDEVTLTAKIEAGKICDIRCKARGCSISTASCSMMTEKIKGKSFKEASFWIDEVKKLMAGNSKLGEDDLEDLEALKGVSNFPVRVKCALLSWMTLQKALDRIYNTRREKR